MIHHQENIFGKSSTKLVNISSVIKVSKEIKNLLVNFVLQTIKQRIFTKG